MLHYDSTEETHVQFLSEIKYRLYKESKTHNLAAFELSGPTISSDQEKAITSAVKFVWPNCELVYCSLHLQKNLQQHLKEKTMLSKANQKKIVDAIFREGSGLVYSNQCDFLEKRTKFESDFHKLYRRSTYLQNFLDRIETNVCHPVWSNQNLSHSHKNNDSETFNSIMKLKTLRKNLKVPQLIEVFIRIFTTQEKLVQCAICKFGKLSVKPWLRKLTMDHDRWQRLTPEQQAKKTTEFFKGPSTRPEKITSKQGDVTMKNVSKAAKKKGAKKNHTKTTTIRKMQKSEKARQAAAGKAKMQPKINQTKKKNKQPTDSSSDEESDYQWHTNDSFKKKYQKKLVKDTKKSTSEQSDSSGKYEDFEKKKESPRRKSSDLLKPKRKTKPVISSSSEEEQEHQDLKGDSLKNLDKEKSRAPIGVAAQGYSETDYEHFVKEKKQAETAEKDSLESSAQKMERAGALSDVQELDNADDEKSDSEDENETYLTPQGDNASGQEDIDNSDEEQSAAFKTPKGKNARKGRFGRSLRTPSRYKPTPTPSPKRKPRKT